MASWLTSSKLQQLNDAARTGMAVGEERLNIECPGVQGAGVSAAGCIVAPAGCTANFIFASGGTRYVGTARHCVNSIGEEVAMQVDTTTIAVVGTVSHMTSGEGVPGNDWALIRIDPAVAAKWGVTPAVPVAGGPNGVYTGCDVGTPVLHYGHGYGVAVAQGKLEGGVATNWHDDGFGWAGFGAPGDSGSAVVTAERPGRGQLHAPDRRRRRLPRQRPRGHADHEGDEPVRRLARQRRTARRTRAGRDDGRLRR